MNIDPLKDIPNRGRPIKGTPYKIGDPIGYMWFVCGSVGKGGMGVVYLVYDKYLKAYYALKSFKEEYLSHVNVRRSFRREVETWIALENHPYIVEATWVEEVGSRLFVQMDYIPPSKGIKGSSLAAHLERGPLSEKQTLKWAIQFCFGIEHAYSHGIKCHRDIKPGNILIDQNSNVRISDFGLAKALDELDILHLSQTEDTKTSLMSQSKLGGCGTPPYMPPEQFKPGNADVRNDIYSFGVVLFEMLKGKLPYWVKPPLNKNLETMEKFWKAWEKAHNEEPVPFIEGELGDVIMKCLAKKPEDRYQSFANLREDLSQIYRRITGLNIADFSITETRKVDLVNKGASLLSLGHYEEAVKCLDLVLKKEPKNPSAWHNKGHALVKMGRLKEADFCFDKAIELKPWDARAWCNKAANLDEQGRRDDALFYYDKAIELDPTLSFAWNNKGMCLKDLGRYKEAIRCFDEAIKVDPKYSKAWANKGVALKALGYLREAGRCFDKALEIDPQNKKALYHKRRFQE